VSVVPANDIPPRKGKKKKVVEEFVTNRLHPVQVEYSYPIGAKVDMDRTLPLDPEEEDPEELLDLFSSPPDFEDRISPVSCQFNSETLSAINPADLVVKFVRKLTINLGKVANDIELACKTTFGEKGPVSFMGLGLDPDTIARIIEADYDTADNVYSRLMELVERGFISPVATTPFHTLLPLHQHEFELRLLVRIGMEIYWPLLKKYNRSVAKHLGEKYFIMPFWLPEGAYSAKVLQILHQEFVKRCESEAITPCHLIILLDSEQSKEREQDVLMKRWNTLRPAPTTRDIVTIMFKERNFTDWVIEGHPSTKKQLDRTIAKVDAVLRDQAIDHLWSHFEPLDTLLSTFKTCQNFEQKIVKLTELKYQPCGPDIFVRRKLLKIHGMEETEPRRTTLKDNTSWAAYADTPGSMVRFLGYEETGGFTPKRVLGEERPYPQRLADGTKKMRRGSPIWKPALMAGLQRLHRLVVGEPKTFMGGMLGTIREILPIRRVPIAMRNIEDFLVIMARVAWKEHFIHHVCSEADIQLRELCMSYLLKDAPDDEEEPELTDDDCIQVGAAAHGIYLAFAGLNSTAFAFPNMDNRAVYENVAMMTLAVAHAMHVYTWRGEKDKAAELFAAFKEELLDFDNAFTRQKLGEQFGVDLKTWKDAIASEIPQESPLNVVTRAARRLGAKHLRDLGLRAEFDRKDEFISNATGHIWTHEVEHLNYKWENEVFCGLREE
jgi:hypothetical protein